MINEISVASLDKRFKKYEKEIKKIALKTFKILKKKNVSADIYLVGSQKAHFLNKKFRGKDKAANVLSFCEPKGFIYPKSKFKNIGEIYLNLEIPNSKSQIPILLIHSLLHLLGYHHKKKNDRMKMEKKERYVYHRFRHRFISNKNFNG